MYDFWSDEIDLFINSIFQHSSLLSILEFFPPSSLFFINSLRVSSSELILILIPDKNKIHILLMKRIMLKQVTPSSSFSSSSHSHSLGNPYHQISTFSLYLFTIRYFSFFAGLSNIRFRLISDCVDQLCNNMQDNEHQ